MKKRVRILSPVRAIAAPLAATLFLAWMSLGEQYSFIVSGFPAANISYPSASEPTTLAPGAIVAMLDVSGADMRSGTIAATDGVSLRSDKPLSFIMIVR